jgi:hypothetical protein
VTFSPLAISLERHTAVAQLPLWPDTYFYQQELEGRSMKSKVMFASPVAAVVGSVIGGVEGLFGLGPTYVA